MILSYSDFYIHFFLHIKQLPSLARLTPSNYSSSGHFFSGQKGMNFVDCEPCRGHSTTSYSKVSRQEFCIGESLEPRGATQSRETTAQPTLREGGGGRGVTQNTICLCFFLSFFRMGTRSRGEGWKGRLPLFFLYFSFFFSFCFQYCFSQVDAACSGGEDERD